MSEPANEANSELQTLIGRGYQHGFVTEIDSDTIPPGLDEDVVRLISRKKGEPSFLTEWRLKALRHCSRCPSRTGGILRSPRSTTRGSPTTPRPRRRRTVRRASRRSTRSC